MPFLIYTLSGLFLLIIVIIIVIQLLIPIIRTKKRNSNSFQKYNNLYKINLKILSRKNSMKQNSTKKYICPIRNQSKIIKEETKNDNTCNSHNNISSKNGEISYICMNNTQVNLSIYSEENNLKRYNNIKYSEEYKNDILDNLLNEEKRIKNNNQPKLFLFPI